MRTESTENAVLGLQTLFSFWFSPLGASVSSLIIQKSSRRFNHSVRVSILTFYISVNCSDRVKFACFMNLSPCILRWLHAVITFGLLTSFLWIFSLKLKEVSDFPTYWILHNMHSIKQITYWLLHVSLWSILKVLFVCWLVNVCILNTCVQHNDGLVELQGMEFPFSLVRFFLKIISCLSVWPPIISWRFLLRLNAITGVSLKTQ